MASTYSTNLKIELIGTGEQSGTWGTTTNTNLGTLIEQAIAGYVTQAVTDGAATVLTIPDGASSNGRNYVIELTGTLTAARTVEVPAVDKPYIFFNNTTGGYSVTVKVTGQTGVTIANGKKAIVYTNSTDVIEVVNAPVSEAGTQTLTNKTLSSPTVTGVATFAAGTVSAPALTTTGDTNTGIFFPAADTIAFAEGGVESMRIDSSGNVGIGTASTGGYRVAVVGSTASSIPLYFNTDTSNGYVYTPNNLYLGSTGANITAFVTNNTERMRIDSSGLVGIGTSSPSSAKLVISGNSLGNSNIRLINTAAGGRTWDICPFAVGINDGYFTIRDATAGAERFTIESGGNVGIGVSATANLTSKLNVGNAALASFTGTTAGVMTLIDTSSTSDRFTALDFTTSGQATPVARIGMKYTGAGSQFFFGTSTSYVSGVNVTAMTLDQSGNLTATGNVTAYSDARLKKNVTTIDNALELVEKMRGVRYERIDSGKAGVGVIAQEMQEIVPEVVHEGENLSVAYGNLVGVLIEAVKELSARVKELEAK